MNAVPVATTRRALAELPAETRSGETPALRDVYLPRSHLKAVHSDSPLVIGMRGAGKTFWWSALQDPDVRGLAGEHPGRSQRRRTTVLNRDTVVRAGFGERAAADEYPSKETLSRLMSAGVAPRTIWRTVQAWHLASYGEDEHPLRRLSSWETRTGYVADNPEATERLFRDRDDEFERKGVYFLMVFDALDRCADDWSNMHRAIRGLLQATLELRSYRWLRAKVFLRSDQMDEGEIADFPDASKVLSAAVELSWPRHELYGLLWHNLANGESGDVFRRLLEGDEWTSTIVDGRKLYAVPRHLIADESRQREKFEAIAGPTMGRDPRHGSPYTWIPIRLADTQGRTSPHSFLAALRKAAGDTAEQQPEYRYALHYESVRRGVQEASKMRIRELEEDYPWVNRALDSLKGMDVPCAFDEIASTWRRERVLERLAEDAGRDESKLPPRHLDHGADGVRRDLESLGIFHQMRDGRINIPDVFRVGYGLGRRGGVAPAQTHMVSAADRLARQWLVRERERDGRGR